VPPLQITDEPGVTVKQLAAGFFHTCALLSNDTVKCWGDANQGGQLGYGNGATIGDDELPSSVGAVQVSSDPKLKVTSLVAGAYHTCALLSDASVKCWGGNDQGELGYGNTESIGDDELPSSVGAVSVSSDPELKVAALAAGSFHTCALLSDGSVQCWGGGLVGKLGYGNTEDIGDDELPSSLGPVQLTNDVSLKAIALVAGGEHTCALMNDRSVVCWGYNNEGELGHANKQNIGDDEVPASAKPVALNVSAAVKVTALVAGGEHTCAGFDDSTVKCWGANFYGQLGYSSTKNIGDDELPIDVGAVPLF
jgi:alpha-tubulin suppressor-like RCC1 family protein